jgi:hypothetical protein
MIFKNNIIKGVIPFVGTLLIACGFIKINIYFNHFRIRIQDYLEITEVVTLFLGDIIKYGLFVFAIILFNFLRISRAEDEKNNDIKWEIVTSKKFWTRVKAHYRLSVELHWVSLLCVIYLIILSFWFPEKLDGLRYVLLIGPSILFFNFLLLEFRSKYFQVYDKELNQSVNNLLILFFLFSLYSIGSSFIDIEKVKNGNSEQISFVYPDKSLHTNEELVFIGQTKNYLFLNDFALKKSQVFERKNITNFKITQANKVYEK